MACNQTCQMIRRFIPAQGLTQLTRNATYGSKISACFAAISQHPQAMGMVGVRMVSKAKPPKGAPKIKRIPGYRVGVTKGFETHHTGSLKGSYNASERMLDDVMMRKYIEGIFYDELDSEIIIKRRDNRIIISFLVNRESDVTRFYFLSSFSEKILGEALGCIVKFEPQAGA